MENKMTQRGLGIAFLVASLAAGTAQAGQCPSNAVKASFELWPVNSMSIGQPVSGLHSCGKRIRCTAGDAAKGGKRTCSWM